MIPWLATGQIMGTACMCLQVTVIRVQKTPLEEFCHSGKTGHFFPMQRRCREIVSYYFHLVIHKRPPIPWLTLEVFPGSLDIEESTHLLGQVH